MENTVSLQARAMSKIKHLQISASVDTPLLTPAQKRFNALLKQIEKARQVLAAWQLNIPLYQQAQAQVLDPLRANYLAGRRLWLMALADLLGQPGWNRNERGTLQDQVCEVAAELLATNPEDAEVKALFNQYNEIDFEAEQQQAVQHMKRMAEAMTGLDLGDLDAMADEEALFKRVHEGLEAQRAAELERGEHGEGAGDPAPRRQTAAQQRREAEALQATKSVREVYRKLASALHPDRAPDEAQRQAKTRLMQRVNQAYAANDLLALLELQLEIEQVDAGHIALASADRVKHYNQVLTEQLAELKAEIEHLEMSFCHDFGIPFDANVKPAKLLDLIAQGARELKALTADQQQDLRLLADRAATKRWLKRWQQRQKRGGFDDGFFF